MTQQQCGATSSQLVKDGKEEDLDLSGDDQLDKEESSSSLSEDKSDQDLSKARKDDNEVVSCDFGSVIDPDLMTAVMMMVIANHEDVGEEELDLKPHAVYKGHAKNPQLKRAPAKKTPLKKPP